MSPNLDLSLPDLNNHPKGYYLVSFLQRYRAAGQGLFLRRAGKQLHRHLQSRPRALRYGHDRHRARSDGQRAGGFTSRGPRLNRYRSGPSHIWDGWWPESFHPGAECGHALSLAECRRSAISGNPDHRRKRCRRREYGDNLLFATLG
jgi:hypothetical protein